MDNPIIRKKEMKWLHNIGVKGIKVDFFGGDKQETCLLYTSAPTTNRPKPTNLFIINLFMSMNNL